MKLPDRSELQDAAAIVQRVLVPTPQQRWPLLCAELGTQVWVKHENHLPVGAFKVRGGLVYLEHLRRAQPACSAVIAATRGNHGQSIGFAAQRCGIAATVYVPHGNSPGKNAAMRALGVTLVEHGRDFQEAVEEARRVARESGVSIVPAFHADLVSGVATCWTELLGAVPDLDVIFVPIGMGSGVVACVAAREALGLRTRIVGVASAGAPGMRLSFEAGHPVEAPVTTRLADGLACRLADPQALALIRAHVDDVVLVDDAEVAQAMRLLFTTTHNAAEGAGAAGLAAAWQQRERLRGKKVGISITGGNVDAAVFAEVLRGTWA